MIKAVLFDLDGTLLPNDEELFAKLYFASLGKKMSKYGFTPESFIEGMNYGAYLMFHNDGKKTNEELFKEGFKIKTGRDLNEIENIIIDYYQNEYKETVKALGKDPDALASVKLCHQKGLKVILASNPLFPKIAYLNRMNYNGLEESDFDEITSYDLYHYAKPNPKYYQEILDRHHLKADEAIMFGNEPKLDIEGASIIGIKSYLVHGEKGISSKEMLKIIKAL